MSEPILRRGIYYIPQTNSLLVLTQIMKTLVMDKNGIDHRAWMVTVENENGNVGRGYIEDTKSLVFLGDL